MPASENVSEQKLQQYSSSISELDDALRCLGAVMSLVSLPSACLLTALLFLDVKDALRFWRACRRFNMLLKLSQNDYWLLRLRKDFGLQVQV